MTKSGTVPSVHDIAVSQCKCLACTTNSQSIRKSEHFQDNFPNIKQIYQQSPGLCFTHMHSLCPMKGQTPAEHTAITKGGDGDYSPQARVETGTQ